MAWYERLAAWCELRGRFKVLHDRERRSIPYMTRYQVLKTPPVSVYLHKIHRGDDSPEYHDHPWPFWHMILAGAYREEYLDRKGRNRFRYVGQGWSAFHRPRYGHRLELLAREGFTGFVEVWTLVVIGPKVRNWGFIGPLTRCWVPWERYVFNRERCE